MAGIPGTMDFLNWETFENGSKLEACFLNVTAGDGTCHQGSVPTIGVDARVVEDVVNAVKFARTWNLRVVVKSTG